MTREEVIGLLSGLMFKGKLKEALDMAIKALEQEPFKPMVEIDLDYVIKQKYIEREVLDKIRAEIDNALSDGMIHKKTVLGIIDKYKAESEPQESEV